MRGGERSGNGERVGDPASSRGGGSVGMGDEHGAADEVVGVVVELLPDHHHHHLGPVPHPLPLRHVAAKGGGRWGRKCIRGRVKMRSNGDTKPETAQTPERNAPCAKIPFGHEKVLNTPLGACAIGRIEIKTAKIDT